MKKNFFKTAEIYTEEAGDKGLGSRLQAVDLEFRSFLQNMTFKRAIGDKDLKTYSPLDEVYAFDFQGIQGVTEVSTDDMIDNCDAFKKLLANMLSQCQPGALSDDDVRQLSGINGRELMADI